MSMIDLCQFVTDDLGHIHCLLVADFSRLWRSLRLLFSLVVFSVNPLISFQRQRCDHHVSQVLCVCRKWK